MTVSGLLDRTSFKCEHAILFYTLDSCCGSVNQLGITFCSVLQARQNGEGGKATALAVVVVVSRIQGSVLRAE